MIRHLFANFMNDDGDYRASEGYWEALWLRTDANMIEKHQWIHPWISTGSPDYLDGNPIFSACSRSLRRGVRIIQHEPTTQRLEIQAWPDFVGGSYHDPDAIQELVISCALSEAAADWAMSLLRFWVAGRSISFDMSGSGQVATFRRSPEWALDGFLLPSAA